MSTTQRIVAGVRWIAVLPAAIIAGFVATFPVHWLVMMLQTNTEGDSSLWSLIPPATLERLGYALFVPFTVVVVAAYVAPRFRLATAASVVGLIAGLLVFARIFLESTLQPWQQVLTACLWLVSFAGALVYVRKHLRAESEPSRVFGWN
jgi:hypothetical protein